MKLKIKIPKIKPKTSGVLTTLLIVALIGELMTLHYALYGKMEDNTEGGDGGKNRLQEVDIDLVEYNKIKNWIEERRNFVLPNYLTASSTTGRVNPFAEY